MAKTLPTLPYVVRNADGKLIAQFLDPQEADEYAAARTGRTVQQLARPDYWRLYKQAKA